VIVSHDSTEKETQSGTGPGTASGVRRRQRHVVCRRDELGPGTTKLYAVGRRQIVVAHIPDGGYVALSNYCAHQGGPLSAGSFQPMWVGDQVGEHAKDAERWVLICPYHNFETDVRSGCPVFPLGRSRTANYKVVVEDEDIVVYL
jgi:nitrite reductase (NADH) small subunit